MNDGSTAFPAFDIDPRICPIGEHKAEIGVKDADMTGPYLFLRLKKPAKLVQPVFGDADAVIYDIDMNPAASFLDLNLYESLLGNFLYSMLQAVFQQRLQNQMNNGALQQPFVIIPIEDKRIAVAQLLYLGIGLADSDFIADMHCFGGVFQRVFKDIGQIVDQQAGMVIG